MPREFSRRLRVNEQLRRELSALIRDRLADPRVAGVTVTAVSVSPDLRQARVTVSSLADDAGLALAIAGLNSASGRLRHGLSERLRLRILPQLSFVADRALREGDRVNRLIREAIDEDARHHPATPADDAANAD